MRGDTVKILKRQVADLERAMKQILEAPQDAYGVYYCIGAAESALEILKRQRERAS